MIRVSKLTDYAMVILANIGQKPSKLFQARELAENTGIALPTVSKLLKQLAKCTILTSTRGSHGGYQLAKSPEEISVAQIIEALEGPLAMMDCLSTSTPCVIATKCQINSPWVKINRLIKSTLENYSLASLITGVPNE